MNGMAKLLTLEDVKVRLSSLGLSYVAGEYTGNTSELTVQCPHCPNTFTQRYLNIINRGYDRCPDCMRRQRNERYVKQMQDLGAIVLQYTAVDEPCTCQCTDCGDTYTVYQAKIITERKKTTCAKCSHKRRGKMLRRLESDAEPGIAYVLHKNTVRRATDLNYKILHDSRRRLHNAFKSANQRKSTKTLDLIGCSILDLILHLAKQFQPGMTLENYGGSDGWVIDHRLPCCAFDLRCPLQQRLCFGFENLQPLWYRDNLAKISQDIALQAAVEAHDPLTAS